MQAKVSELEQQVDELAQRISLLTTEKANLDSRVNILVRVLRMRDEEIAQLQQKVKVRAWVLTLVVTAHNVHYAMIPGGYATFSLHFISQLFQPGHATTACCTDVAGFSPCPK